ncbi:MAG TPA: dihydroxyacetone kinase family protein [Propionibacteriaceae bacterium]
MKKLINDPRDVVRESLEGVVLTQPGTALLGDQLTVVRTDRVVEPTNRARLPVALVSGGGAGHEPAHAGYVARGMLTAAVSGDVFSSPSVDAVLDGLVAVTGDAGTLLIVKSYTGDRLNFGLAAELARATGLDVELVVVADDVAIATSDANAGRRGLAGTVLVHKAAGACAEAGGSLAEVTEVARRVSAGLGTMGVGLTAVTLPAAGEPAFVLEGDEVELGLGIHGEPGVRREKLRPADALVTELVDRIVLDRKITAGARVVALVNSTGATPPMELSIVSRSVAAELDRRDITLVRLWQGLLMTSLDLAGVSLTLLEIQTGEDGDQLLALLDAPTDAVAWPSKAASVPPRLSVVSLPTAIPNHQAEASGAVDPDLRAALDAACQHLLDQEAALNRLDQEVGDGDLGAALARGARAWLAAPADGSAATMLRQLSVHARRAIGGTSGPLYAVGLLRAAERLSAGETWPEAFRAGVAAIQELGGAEVGDRTMIDALAPAADAAEAGWDAAVDAARSGADSTGSMSARRGRSSYLGDRVHGHPDPGAVAVVHWLSVLRDELSPPSGDRDRP